MAGAVGIGLFPQTRGALRPASRDVDVARSIPQEVNNRKTPGVLPGVFLAGAVGIEPTQGVLETPVLPLYDAPKRQNHSQTTS